MTHRHSSGTIADRRVSMLAGIALMAFAVAAIVVVSAREQLLLLPVTLDLPGVAPGASDPTPRFEFGHVDLGLAVVVVLILSAILRLASRMPGSRWIERGLIVPITTFLVAGINGITDAGALISIYSLTSAMVLFDVAQLRSDGISATSPWGFGTMVGIVPWGIIALHQVGGGLAGHPAPLIVQVITMTVLILSMVTSYAFWRERARSTSGHSHILLSTLSLCVFAVEALVLAAS